MKGAKFESEEGCQRNSYVEIISVVLLFWCADSFKVVLLNEKWRLGRSDCEWRQIVYLNGLGGYESWELRKSWCHFDWLRECLMNIDLNKENMLNGMEDVDWVFAARECLCSKMMLPRSRVRTLLPVCLFKYLFYENNYYSLFLSVFCYTLLRELSLFI